MEQIINIKLEAESKAQALEVLTDLISIRKSIGSDADVKELARLLKKNPGIIETAKKFLG